MKKIGSLAVSMAIVLSCLLQLNIDVSAAEVGVAKAMYKAPAVKAKSIMVAPKTSTAGVSEKPVLKVDSVSEKPVLKVDSVSEKPVYKVAGVYEVPTNKFHKAVYENRWNNRASSIYASPKRDKVSIKVTKKNKKAVISWNKISQADGYELVYSNDKNINKQVKKISVRKNDNSRLVGGLKKKAYFFKVRSFKKIGNKKIYGEWSMAKKLSF